MTLHYGLFQSARPSVSLAAVELEEWMNDMELLHRLTKYANPASVCTVSASNFPLWRVGAGVPSAGNTELGIIKGKNCAMKLMGSLNRLFPLMLILIDL